MQTTPIALVAAVMALASALPALASDNVRYAPMSQDLSDSGSYLLSITSPEDLNARGRAMLAGNGSITADILVSLVAWPEGADPSAAPQVTTDPVALTFGDLGETRTVNVDVALGAAAEGDYIYSIQARGPASIGWGNSSSTLTVTVAYVDTTPPVVWIDDPTESASVLFRLGGTPVPVTVCATDGESGITRMESSVDGELVSLDCAGLCTNAATGHGLGTVATIGSHIVGGSAESLGGVGHALPVCFTVNYALSWLPPIANGNAINGGSNAQIKFAVRDCDGNFVRDESVLVEISMDGGASVLAAFGTGANVVKIDEGLLSDPTDGQYSYNFKTAKGVHTYEVKVLFAGTVEGVPVDALEQGWLTFTTK